MQVEDTTGRVRGFRPLTLVMALVCLLLFSTPAVAATPSGTAETSESTQSVRDERLTLQGGAGVFIFLPSLRVVGRYSLEPVSIELRGGVFVPSFAIGKVAWDAAFAIRYHFWSREDLTAFVAPRVGIWNITDEGEPYEQAPMASLTSGIDLHWGEGWTATFEGGVGVVGGQPFNTDPPAGVFLIELNAYVGWTF